MSEDGMCALNRRFGVLAYKSSSDADALVIMLSKHLGNLEDEPSKASSRLFLVSYIGIDEQSEASRGR